MNDKDKLLKQIEEAKLKLELLEKQEKNQLKDNAIKKLEEFSIEEKILFFDKLYKSAEKELIFLEKNNWSSEDNKQYAWEEYIQILSKDYGLFWKYWNSLDK